MRELQRTIYFENSAGRIWEEPAGYLRIDYHPGQRDEGEFRALLTHLRQAMGRAGHGKMLINQRDMTAFSPSEAEWVGSEWLPTAVNENGYRYGAILVAKNVFARLAMSKVSLARKGLNHQYENFEDEAAAIAWLLAQKAGR